MPSILRLLNLLLCGLLYIPPIFARAIRQGKSPSAEDIYGDQFAALNADRSKSKVEEADPIKAPMVVHVLNDYTKVTCDLRGMDRSPRSQNCHAAVAQASNHTNGYDVPDLLQVPTRSTWSDGSCGVFTPTFDEVSKSNVTWTGVMDALNGILTNCNVDGKVLGAATINHGNGDFIVGIQYAGPSTAKSDFGGSWWGRGKSFRQSRPSRRLRR